MNRIYSSSLRMFMDRFECLSRVIWSAHCIIAKRHIYLISFLLCSTKRSEILGPTIERESLQMYVIFIDPSSERKGRENQSLLECSQCHNGESLAARRYYSSCHFHCISETSFSCLSALGVTSNRSRPFPYNCRRIEDGVLQAREDLYGVVG